MIDINSIREHVFTMLEKEAPSSLTYHNADHTIDVARQALIIAEEEGITDKQNLFELEVAAIYHDTGLIHVYKGHEEKSCDRARRELPHYGVNTGIIENISELILATRMPQSPGNILQQIICDADLDYLGHDNYYKISENLRKEFMIYKIVENEEEWKRSRIAFLQSHSYFTKSAHSRRTQKKLNHLQRLLQEETQPATSH
jgi:predicted metal-dependent HD superfamily phosphohydrolase